MSKVKMTRPKMFLVSANKEYVVGVSSAPATDGQEITLLPFSGGSISGGIPLFVTFETPSLDSYRDLRNGIMLFLHDTSSLADATFVYYVASDISENPKKLHKISNKDWVMATDKRFSCFKCQLNNNPSTPFPYSNLFLVSTYPSFTLTSCVEQKYLVANVINRTLSTSSDVTNGLWTLMNADAPTKITQPVYYIPGTSCNTSHIPVGGKATPGMHIQFELLRDKEDMCKRAKGQYMPQTQQCQVQACEISNSTVVCPNNTEKYTVASATIGAGQNAKNPSFTNVNLCIDPRQKSFFETLCTIL